MSVPTAVRTTLLLAAAFAAFPAAIARADRAPADTASAPAATDSSSVLALADQVAQDVAAIRGWPFKHPVEKHVYTEDQLREYVVRQLDKEYPEEMTRRSERFLRWIGALPDSVPLRGTLVKVLLSQIGGFYDPDTQAFYMIGRQGVDYGPTVNSVLIAHELTHALDDQYVSLDSLQQARPRTEDDDFVTGALVEGSATELMTRWITRAQRQGKLDMGDLQKLMASEEKRSRIFFEAPRYFQTLLAHYTCGMGFLLRGDATAILSGGGSEQAGENFLHAVADPPASGEQILHPEKYWNPEKLDLPVVVDDDAVAARMSPLGYRVEGTNTAGELLVDVITTPKDLAFNPMAAGLPAYWTNRAATGWGGDRFYLLQGEAGAEAGVWITLWDTGQDRDEFLESYTEALPEAAGSRFLLGARGAVFTFGVDAEAVQKALASAPPAMTCGGEPWSPDRPGAEKN